MSTAGVLLAAGASARFGGAQSKLLAGFRGRPLIDWALDALLSADLDDAFVIAGRADLTYLSDRVDVVPNPRWSDGQATSLAKAVATAHDRDHDAIVVGLADMPFVPPEAWSAVAASTSPIAVATYDGRRRNPVKLDRSVWPLLPAGGDRGARGLIEDRVDLVEEIPCPGVPVDIDTPEDLTRWS